MKKRGLEVGYYNGPGGKNMINESFIDCTICETQEELCITHLNPVYAGTLKYQVYNGHRICLEVFQANDFIGIPAETEEVSHIWFSLNAIPYHNVWKNDAIWYLYLLSGELFTSMFVSDQDELVDYEIIVQK
jgi:hypothetical protein